MSADLAFPLHPDVVLHLAEGPQDDLTLITRVTGALMQAGYATTVAAFLALAQEADTYDDLLQVIYCTVTVL